MSKLTNLLGEMRRRRVFRMTAIYLVAAWAAVQVAAEAFPALNIPEAAIRYVWIVGLVGFPIAVVFSWKYDITTEGIVRTRAADEDAAADHSLKKVDYAVLAVLAVVVMATLYNAGQRLVQVQTETALAPTTRVINPNSIAVLPLENLSPNPDDAYFAAGVHDALITNLSKISALMVTSRQSTLRVAPDLSVPEIGRQLGVAKLLEGSVLMDGDHVRVIVQLIDAASDLHIWAETFERDLTNIIALQNEVARTIAGVVEIRLTPREEAALTRVDPIRPDLYRKYLQGMYQFFQDTPEADWRGVEILKEVVREDPNSALAHAGLAYGYANIAHSPSKIQFEDLGTKAREAAEIALRLNPEQAEAYMALGMYLSMYEWDFQGAERAFKRAIELNPNLTLAYYDLAWVYEIWGPEWEEESLEAGDRTRELSPLQPFMLGGLAWQYMDACRYEEALSLAKESLRIDPEHPISWLALGFTYADMGRFDESINAYKKLAGTIWEPFIGVGYAFAGLEDKARKVAVATEANPFMPAWIYAALGERDKALYWLEKAEESRHQWYPYLLGHFPGVENIADDGRFRALAEDFDLPDPRTMGCKGEWL